MARDPHEQRPKDAYLDKAQATTDFDDAIQNLSAFSQLFSIKLGKIQPSTPLSLADLNKLFAVDPDPIRKLEQSLFAQQQRTSPKQIPRSFNQVSKQAYAKHVKNDPVRFLPENSPTEHLLTNILQKDGITHVSKLLGSMNINDATSLFKSMAGHRSINAKYLYDALDQEIANGSTQFLNVILEKLEPAYADNFIKEWLDHSESLIKASPHREKRESVVRQLTNDSIAARYVNTPFLGQLFRDQIEVMNFERAEHQYPNQQFSPSKLFHEIRSMLKESSTLTLAAADHGLIDNFQENFNSIVQQITNEPSHVQNFANKIETLIDDSLNKTTKTPESQVSFNFFQKMYHAFCALIRPSQIEKPKISPVVGQLQDMKSRLCKMKENAAAKVKGATDAEGEKDDNSTSPRSQK